MNAKQFCEKYGKKYKKKIPQWYKAGYMPGASKNESTGDYSIPEDTPVPYVVVDKRVKKISNLFEREEYDYGIDNMSGVFKRGF